MISLTVRKQMVLTDKQLSITVQCELLGINRSSFYYKPVEESEENLAIMRVLDEQYLNTPFYGNKRLLFILICHGYRINIKRLRRLMKIVGWQTLYPVKHTTHADPDKYKYPYLLKGLVINHANQVWEIDITYIPMERGFMYLFAIIDVHTRYVVGWGLSNSMTAEWCVSVIEQAIATHGVPQIINSDQGSQFTSDMYVALLTEKGIKISMDSKGRAIDNIYIERLWRSVKYENIYLFVYTNGKALYEGLDAYFTFYNMKRPHQGLDNKIPWDMYSKEEKMKVA
jgi:putative transposase